MLNLISLYVSNEVKIAEAWSWASENVERQVFTNESLKKIDEREEQKFQAARKARHSKEFKNIVEKNNEIEEITLVIKTAKDMNNKIRERKKEE